MESKARHYLAWCTRERKLNEPRNLPERPRSLSNPPPLKHRRSHSDPTHSKRRSLSKSTPLKFRRRSFTDAPPGKRRWFLPFHKKTSVKSPRKSPLLMLPPEIRDKIYMEIVGGKLIHLTQLRRRLGHFRCHLSDSIHEQDHHRKRLCIPGSRRRMYWAGEPPVGREDDISDDGGLALLQTCRQIYNECIGLLYTTNVFDINHPQTLVFLAKTIIPQRLAMIRTLQVSFPGIGLPRGYGSIIDPRLQEPDGIATWVEMCNVISTKMTGLKSLTLGFERSHLFKGNGDLEDVPREDVAMLCQHLCALRGLKKFDIKIYPASWDVSEFADELRALFQGAAINVIAAPKDYGARAASGKRWKRQSISAVSGGWKRLSRDISGRFADTRRFSLV